MWFLPWPRNARDEGITSLCLKTDKGHGSWNLILSIIFLGPMYENERLCNQRKYVWGAVGCFL